MFWNLNYGESNHNLQLRGRMTLKRRFKQCGPQGSFHLQYEDTPGLPGRPGQASPVPGLQCGIQWHFPFSPEGIRKSHRPSELFPGQCMNNFL